MQAPMKGRRDNSFIAASQQAKKKKGELEGKPFKKEKKYTREKKKNYCSDTKVNQDIKKGKKKQDQAKKRSKSEALHWESSTPEKENGKKKASQSTAPPSKSSRVYSVQKRFVVVVIDIKPT
ncbi:uncharacterized protein ARB_05399 [Trichophyton benhamiae CBS 112371]|uniref:Uncharacterized protein n=1 Tax=Arthroderma benhamiae (strain ATCC MYA-4681 / CBS 112371) TaxID=663331 RepID=D4AME6_ARTBC|nr:uncharacterized protein ARB_05399 [Trichophyton benhamiae CBS 112371]EFE35357.1 hypothetical protein ARB_05399 [Trichophyton benhamiae CBS 112371]